MHACLKGMVHPKMKILPSFTYPQVIPNMCEFLCSVEHKGRDFEECLLHLPQIMKRLSSCDLSYQI